MARPRTYVIPFLSVVNPGIVPFLQIATPATMAVELVSLNLAQEDSEISEQAIVTMMRRTTASTLPTAQTPLKLNALDPAAALTGTTTTCAYGVASVNGTASDVLKRFSFNVLNGLLWLPIDDERITMGVSGFMTLQFLTAPGATIKFSGDLIFRELI